MIGDDLLRVLILALFGHVSKGSVYLSFSSFLLSLYNLFVFNFTISQYKYLMYVNIVLVVMCLHYTIESFQKLRTS